jgi:glycosyltransferase involved in cell wall biosynthesis
MARLADTVVVYTETQATELRALLPKVRILAAPNALYSAASMGTAFADGPPTNFIYVGRLVTAKKPDLLLQAFLMMRDRLPPESQLIIVGDGPLRPALEVMIVEHDAGESVRVEGHVSDPARLRQLYASCIAAIAPGYVGLSITQSLSFGVPMIYARNEPHAPEIEAAVEGVNSESFQENDAASLGDALVSFWSSRERWLSARQEIARDCASRYSIDLMVERIIEACRMPEADASPETELIP